MKKKGYPYRGGNENVAYNWGGSDPAKKAFTQWMNSPGHNRNMLAPRNNVQATSVVVKNGKWWFC